jgi:hypothetical protein
MNIEPLTCHIGAELIGVNLADAIENDGLFSAIKAALLKYKVLFLRDQAISRAQHVAFAERFGALESHPVVGSLPDYPGLVPIYKSPDKPIDRYENAWHTDATWREALLWVACCVVSNAPMSEAIHCGLIWQPPTQNCLHQFNCVLLIYELVTVSRLHLVQRCPLKIVWH